MPVTEIHVQEGRNVRGLPTRRGFMRLEELFTNQHSELQSLNRIRTVRRSRQTLIELKNPVIEGCHRPTFRTNFAQCFMLKRFNSIYKLEVPLFNIMFGLAQLLHIALMLFFVLLSQLQVILVRKVLIFM
jgi:hypothetical protein